MRRKIAWSTLTSASQTNDSSAVAAVTHFEIYGEEPGKLAEFYRSLFDWNLEQMPGINYWRIQIDSAEPKVLHGGLDLPRDSRFQWLDVIRVRKRMPSQRYFINPLA